MKKWSQIAVSVVLLQKLKSLRVRAALPVKCRCGERNSAGGRAAEAAPMRPRGGRCRQNSNFFGLRLASTLPVVSQWLAGTFGVLRYSQPTPNVHPVPTLSNPGASPSEQEGTGVLCEPDSSRLPDGQARRSMPTGAAADDKNEVVGCYARSAGRQNWISTSEAGAVSPGW